MKSREFTPWAGDAMRLRTFDPALPERHAERFAGSAQVGGKYGRVGRFSAQNNLNSFGPPAGAASR